MPRDLYSLMSLAVSATCGGIAIQFEIQCGFGSRLAYAILDFMLHCCLASSLLDTNRQLLLLLFFLRLSLVALVAFVWSTMFFVVIFHALLPWCTHQGCGRIGFAEIVGETYLICIQTISCSLIEVSGVKGLLRSGRGLFD